jgi:hypothetical protein
MKTGKGATLEYDLFEISLALEYNATSVCLRLRTFRERSCLEASYPRRTDTSSTPVRKPKTLCHCICLTLRVLRLGVSAE